MAGKKAICWDLDETIGHFKRISYELNNETPPALAGPIALRHGIKELLQQLSLEGFLNIVTTSATTDYAFEALNRTDLTRYMSGVYARDKIVRNGGKHYQAIADSLGLSHQEASANMIVIGDSPGDKPRDLEGIVFIEQEYGSHFDSKVIYKIIKKLLEAGQDDFRKGFEKLYSTARIEKRIEKTKVCDSEIEYEIEYGICDIGEGIEFELIYNTKTCFDKSEEKAVPTITNIKAPQYAKELEVVQEVLEAK